MRSCTNSRASSAHVPVDGKFAVAAGNLEGKPVAVVVVPAAACNLADTLEAVGAGTLGAAEEDTPVVDSLVAAVVDIPEVVGAVDSLAAQQEGTCWLDQPWQLLVPSLRVLVRTRS